jgi:hypothetical protein
LIKAREPLLAFYDFPAEHWKHLRMSNVIESSFATIRHPTTRSKGCLSNKAALAVPHTVLSTHAGQYSSHCQSRPRALLPAPMTGRLFLCARCQAQVFVCSHCARGQIYCAQGCVPQTARRNAQRAAGRPIRPGGAVGSTERCGPLAIAPDTTT